MNRCFIIGGGPSVSDLNLNLIKKEYVIALNEAFRFEDIADLWFFSDSDIFKNHKKEIDAWPGKIVSCAAAAKPCKKIEYYERCRVHGLCMEKGKLSFPSMGANSGATAINLAIRKGFDEIILLGYDLKQREGKNNYHDYYKNEVRADAYIRFNEAFISMAKDIKLIAPNVKIVNANPDSALNCFPKMKFLDTL